MLGLALAIGSALPNGRDRRAAARPDDRGWRPCDEYKHGIGLLELDLTEVTDPTDLLGRTIILDNGVGQTKVIVPEGLNVEIDSHAQARRDLGVRPQGRTAPTTSSTCPATGTGEALTIKIDQSVGNVEVIRS